MDRKYWAAVLNKVIENLTSVKVWLAAAVLGISTKLVMTGLLTGSEFVTLNTGLLGIVFGMREVYKVATVKALPELKDEDKDKIKQA